MSNTAPAPAPAAAPAPAPGKSRRGLLVIAAVVIVLLGGGGAAYWALAGSGPDAEVAEAEPAAPEEAAPAAAVALETFVVNLDDPGRRHFLRVTLTLVVDDEKIAAEIGENAVANMRVRSAILELLALQTADRLVTPAGKTELKTAIAEAAAGALPGLHVIDVLFSDFVVQF